MSLDCKVRRFEVWRGDDGRLRFFCRQVRLTRRMTMFVGGDRFPRQRRHVDLVDGIIRRSTTRIWPGETGDQSSSETTFDVP